LNILVSKLSFLPIFFQWLKKQITNSFVQIHVFDNLVPNLNEMMQCTVLELYGVLRCLVYVAAALLFAAEFVNYVLAGPRNCLEKLQASIQIELFWRRQVLKSLRFKFDHFLRIYLHYWVSVAHSAKPTLRWFVSKLCICTANTSDLDRNNISLFKR
jgi:hypothetical protein